MIKRKLLDLKQVFQVKGKDGKTYDAEYDSSDGQLYIKDTESSEGSSGEARESPTPPPSIMEKSKSEKKPGTPKKMPGGKGSSKKEGEQGEKTKLPPFKLEDNAFRARLRSIMLDNKYDRQVRGRNRGKLDMKALPKAMTGSTSVFTRKEARKNKSYNVMFLVDCSGSMAYDKAPKAADAVSFLLNNFEGINIDTSVILFNEYMWKAKEFGQTYTKELGDEIRHTISTLDMPGQGDNSDYTAMAYAYTQFPKEGTNILVMVSDGQPTTGESFRKGRTTYGSKLDSIEFEEPLGLDWSEISSSGEKTKRHMHNLVKRNAHRVTSIGIGIQQGGWQIPDHEVVNDITELKSTMMKMLRKKVKRG